MPEKKRFQTLGGVLLLANSILYYFLLALVLGLGCLYFEIDKSDCVLGFVILHEEAEGVSEGGRIWRG